VIQFWAMPCEPILSWSGAQVTKLYWYFVPNILTLSHFATTACIRCESRLGTDGIRLIKYWQHCNTVETWLDGLACSYPAHQSLMVATVSCKNASSWFQEFRKNANFLMWDQWPRPLCDLICCKWGGPILRYWLHSLYILLLHMTSCRRAFKGHDRVKVIWGHWLHRLYHQSSMVATVSGKKVPFKCQYF